MNIDRITPEKRTFIEITFFDGSRFLFLPNYEVNIKNHGMIKMRDLEANAKKQVQGGLQGIRKVILDKRKRNQSKVGIQTIIPGDFIKSWNHFEERVEFREVISTFKKKYVPYLFEIKTKSGKELHATADHMFYCLTSGRYLRSDKLSIGTHLRTNRREVDEVLSVKKYKTLENVYNLEVEGYSNYFAENVLSDGMHLKLDFYKKVNNLITTKKIPMTRMRPGLTLGLTVGSFEVAMAFSGMSGTGSAGGGMGGPPSGGTTTSGSTTSGSTTSGSTTSGSTTSGSTTSGSTTGSSKASGGGHTTGSGGEIQE